MTKLAQEIQHLDITVLPVLLPLSQAALVTGLDVATLREMVAQGKVIAGTSLDGDVLVAVREGKVVMLENGQAPNGQANGQATDNGGAHEHQEKKMDVFELNRRLAAIKRDQFKHLQGKQITVSEAARKYKVPPQTIHTWTRRGYIRLLVSPGRGKNRHTIVNEADVAYCATLYHLRKPFKTRAPLLNPDGTPYLLRNPRLAQARRMIKDATS